MIPVKVKDDFYEFKPFRVAKYKIDFGNYKTLGAIEGYTWYTPALLYLWGRFTDINLADLIAKYDFKVFWYLFDKPIFSGLDFKEDKSWNHLLWATPTKDWKNIVDGILETVQFDIPNKLLFQYALQSMSVYDPLSVDKERVITNATPKIDIKAFAVLSNRNQLAFDLKSGFKALPHVFQFKPEPIQIEAAADLFNLPDITQDKAFEAYKRIMTRLQDQEHANRIEAIRQKRR